MHRVRPRAVNPLVSLRQKAALVVGCVLWLAGLALGATKAEQLAEQAKKAEKDGENVRAYILYAEAAAADPTNYAYWERAQALRPIADLMDTSGSKLPDLAGVKTDPDLFGSISDVELAQARRPMPPAVLKITTPAQDYDLRGDSRSIWEQVASTLKLRVLFDPQYQPTQPLRFQLSAADYKETLQALEVATGSFLTPISTDLILVANDTTAKRTEFERTAAAVIPFPEADSVQELQEIVTGVRGLLDSQKLMVDTTRHLILIRDRVTKVRLAQMILEDLLRPRAQVAIEVEILSTDVSSSMNYGLSLPTAFPLVNFSNKSYLLNVIPNGFTTFATFGGGASLIGVGVTSAELFGTVAKSSAKTLLESEVLAQDGMPSSLHIGQKYPIVTNEYIGNTSGKSGTVYTPPPTFNFVDLGLVLKVTPHIHDADEVALDLSAEFKVLEAASNDGIPVVGSTSYESKITVNTGEWAVLAGLMNASEAQSLTGIPLLSAIPLFRNNTITRDFGQTLIVLKPHIVILPPSSMATWKAWTGSETRLPTEF